MKPFAVIISVFVLGFSVATANAQEMHQDDSGRWLNSEGGNVFGDSNWNRDADPKWNRDADPNWNRDGLFGD